MPYRLQELIDVSQLQAFLDSFSGVSGIPAAIIGQDGSAIAISGWSEICLDYHRAHPEAMQCCNDSNARVIAELAESSGIIRYTCPHGFMKAAFALMADGEYLGTMITGQVLLEPPDEQQFRERAVRYGFDEEQYLAALRQVRVIDPQQLDRNITCLQKLTDLIVSMANGARREKAAAGSSALLAQRYASILETTADGFWIVDGEGRCLEANDVFAANLGYSRDELRGMSLRDIDGGETSEEMAERIADILRTGFGRFEALHRRKDGTLLEVEVSTSYIAEENIFVAFVRDISERKGAEALLRESEQRFRSLFEQAPVPYQSLDKDGNLLEVNDAWCRMMGYEASEVIGTGMGNYLTEYARPLLLERISLLAGNGSMTGVDCQLIRKDGTPVDVLVEGSVSHDCQGHFMQTHCILTDITERRRTEEALQERENRLQVVFEASQSGMFMVNPQGMIIMANRRMAEMFACPLEEIIGLPYPRLAHADEQDAANRRMMEILAGGTEVVLTERHYRTMDGGEFWGLVSVRRHVDSDGNLISLVGTLTDITDQKRALVALQESENRFRLLYERAPMPYQSLDAEGRILDVNPAWLQMSGYDRDEVVSHSIADFLTPESVLLLQERFTRFLSTGVTHDTEFQFRCKDGAEKTVVVEGRVGYDMQGNFKQTHCMLIDVSARKQAEKVVQASQKRLQFLLTGTPTVIYTCRTSGDFGATFISDNVISLMGYEPKDFLEDPGFWLMHIHEDDRPRIVADLSNLFTHGRQSHEYRFRTSDGRYRWMHDELVLVRDTEGNPLEGIGCWLDVTDRREAEEEVLRLNEQLEHRVEERTAELEASNRELEAFCYSISHDLRAPLRAIDGCTKILQEDYEPGLDEAGKDLCSRIGSNAVRMGGLIDDLLTFSRVGRASIEMKLLDMGFLVRTVFEELVPPEERHRIDLRVESLPPAMADATTMGQVWANILGNAVKYTSKEAGAIIRVTGRHEGDKLVYCVRDNGVGFDMAYANKLFGVFLRAHSPMEFPGTGVGLAIVERIIHRHGGRVWAEGEVGNGASFYFSLPA